MDPLILPNGRTDLRIDCFYTSRSGIRVTQFLTRTNLLPRAIHRNTVGFTCRTACARNVHVREPTDRRTCRLPIVLVTSDHTCAVQTMLYVTRDKRGYLHSATLELP